MLTYQIQADQNNQRESFRFVMITNKILLEILYNQWYQTKSHKDQILSKVQI